MTWGNVIFDVATPVFLMPQFTLAAAVSLALPLFVVTMASQNLPGVAVTGLLTAFPRELVVAIAALALLGSIGSGLATGLRDESHREAALITFLVTLSGVVIGGTGPAFWGQVAGGFALFVQQYRKI